MILNNLNIVGHAVPVNIRICNEKIADVTPALLHGKTGHLSLSFYNALAFPGLINSHDHLDFNLFPMLGDSPYRNYTEWGHYIHSHYKEEIAKILKIPAQLRYEWGIYKNLLCGVTTVVNHDEKPGFKTGLLTIFEESQCLHSVHFEKHWKIKLNNPLKKELPVNIHAGEGTDDLAIGEIDELIKYNILNRRLIGIHGVSMTEKHAKKFDALVWCPASNYFLLRRTAQVDLLAKHTSILFGTDSTLTGNWNIWTHLRLARNIGMLNDEDLYYSVNRYAASIWRLNAGSIAEGKDADLVIAKQPDNMRGLDAFFRLNPADLLMVIHKGRITLFDESVLNQLHNIEPDSYSRIIIDGACKYVKGDLPGLMNKIRTYNPAIRFPVTVNEPVPI